MQPITSKQKIQVGDEFHCDKPIKTTSLVSLKPGLFTLLDLAPPPAQPNPSSSGSSESGSRQHPVRNTDADSIFVMDQQGKRGWVHQHEFIVYDDDETRHPSTSTSRSLPVSDFKIKKRWMTRDQLRDARYYERVRKNYRAPASHSQSHLPDPSSTKSSKGKGKEKSSSSSLTTATSQTTPVFGETISKFLKDEVMNCEGLHNAILDSSNLEPYRHLIADLPKPSNSSRSRSNYISYPFRAEDLAKFPPPSPGALKRRTLDEVEEDHLEEIERIQNRHAEQKKKMEAKQAKEVEKLKLRHEIEVAEAKVKEAKRKLEEFEKAGSGSD